MEGLRLTADCILRDSIYAYFKKIKPLLLIQKCSGSFLKNINLNFDKKERLAMKYFLLNKQSTVEENVMFTAKILYEQIGDSKLHIDELFLEFIKNKILL